MSDVKRRWDMISDQKRKECIDALIAHFSMERDEKIGIIAATEILDLVLQSIAEEVHNKGIEDARIFLRSKFEDLDVEMSMLSKFI